MYSMGSLFSLKAMAVCLRTYVYEWGRNDSVCCSWGTHYLALHEIYAVDGVHLKLSGVPGGRWSISHSDEVAFLFLYDWRCCPLNFADDPSLMSFRSSWSRIQTCSGVSVRLSSSLLILHFHGCLRWSRNVLSGGSNHQVYTERWVDCRRQRNLILKATFELVVFLAIAN